MKKLISALTVFLFVFGFLNANAQLANTYTFSASTGATLEDMTGSTLLIGSGVDDSPSPLTTFPGGFVFVYEGVGYTQFSVTPDGFCKLGAPQAGIQFTNSITSTTNRPKVFPYWDDMTTGSAAGGGNVSYKIFGTSPTRKFVVQWFTTIPYSTTGPANSTFQLWLNEATCGSGVIDFAYGTMGAAAMSSSVGINSTAANATNFVSVTISTNTASTTVADNSNAGQPPSGTQYTFTPGPPLITDEVGITASNLGAMIVSEGKCVDFTATVSNFGSNPQSGIPVVYTVDGGSDVGPVLTGSMACFGSDVVTFSGANALCNLAPGPHTIAIRTTAGPPVTNRPAVSIPITVLAKISTLPYIQTFAGGDGWTILGQGGTPFWALVACTNPDGLGANLAARANFFSAAAGRVEILRSREFNFSNNLYPVLNFYSAYRAYTPDNSEDRIEVLVSTDHGLTFFPASTPWNKTRFTVPELSTIVSSPSGFTPTNELQWRHETVDLSNVGGLANVIIGFRGSSQFGNNGWIDNVIVSEPASLCTDIVAPAPGTYNCNGNVSLEFTATPAPPFTGGELDNQSGELKSDAKYKYINEEAGNIPSVYGDANVTSSNETHNTNGGTAFVSTNHNVDPGQAINANTTATNPNGGTFTPAEIYWVNTNWWTTTYDGNDTSGYATYNISIDLTGSGFLLVGDLYIVKRTDRTGNWTCQTTTSPSANVLMVTGLTDFCDFAIAGNEAQPVELASFTSVIAGRDVTLNWSTVTEENNAGFDIERKLVSSENWTKISNVTGNGNSSVPMNYVFTDRGLSSGKYNYRLKQIDFNGNFQYYALSNEVNVGVPAKFDLSQNYPNPFNPSTKINYDIPFDGKVSIKVFDMSGKEVATLVNEAKTAGYYSLNFNASNLSSGIYFYRISADANGQSFVSTKKMTLIK